jgi:hypothetical protein
MEERSTANAIEPLYEEFKRRNKTQAVLPSADTAAMWFWALLASVYLIGGEHGFAVIIILFRSSEDLFDKTRNTLRGDL